MTRDDVARAAGVSAAVVSYVLNDGPRPVSDSAREKVLAAVRTLGYRPDRLARALRRGKTDTIGIVVPDIALPYFAEITEALSRLAASDGMQLLIATTGWDLHTERRHLAALGEMRADGVVLMSVDPEREAQAAAELPLRVALIDRPGFGFGSAVLATQHLIDHGHTRIGYMGGPSGVAASERRRRGWASTMSDAGLEAPAELVVTGSVSRSGGYSLLANLLDIADPPSAIFVESDAQAVGLIRAASERGLRLPADLALVSGEGTDLARFSIPSLTTVEQPIDVIAREAWMAATDPESARAVHRIDNPSAVLVIRESCGPHPV